MNLQISAEGAQGENLEGDNSYISNRCVFYLFFFFFFTGAVTELFHSADPDLKPLLSTAIQLTLLPDFDSYRWD